MFHFENLARQKGFRLIIGIDEAGRGPLAGPVVASAVCLKDEEYSFGDDSFAISRPPGSMSSLFHQGKNFKNKITDSKKMSPTQRQQAFLEIFENAYVGIGVVNEAVIDSENILRATFLAMTRAVEQLIGHLPKEVTRWMNFQKKVCLLVDGNSFRTELPYPFQTVIKGDNLSFSIACASIIAKVTRDRILMIYDQIYPQYGFRQHKGYPTQKHRLAIHRHGQSLIHRKTFHVGV